MSQSKKKVVYAYRSVEKVDLPDSSEDERLFWLYLLAEQKDKALSIFDRVTDFKFIDVTLVVGLFGLKIFDYADKFENANDFKSVYGRYATRKTEQKPKHKYAVELISEYMTKESTDSELIEFINTLVEIDALPSVPFVKRFIARICFREKTHFDVELFEKCLLIWCQNGKKKSSMLKFFAGCAAPFFTMDSYDAIINFVNYCAELVNIKTLGKIINYICLTYNDDGSSNIGVLEKFRNEMEIRFGVKISINRIFETFICYDPNYGILNNPINIYCLNQGLTYSDTQIVDEILGQYNNWAYSRNDSDETPSTILDEYLEMMERYMHDGGYSPSTHTNLVLNFLNYEKISKILTHEYLEKFRAMGFDFSSIQHIQLQSTIRTKFFADYILDSFENLEPVLNTLVLCLVAARFDDFDRLFKMASTEIKDDVFDKIWDFEFLCDQLWVYIDIYKPVDVDITKFYSRAPIEKMDDVIEALIEKNQKKLRVENYISKVCWLFGQKKLDFDLSQKSHKLLCLWNRVIEIIPDTKYDKLIVCLFYACDDNDACGLTLNIQKLFKYTVDKLNIDVEYMLTESGAAKKSHNFKEIYWDFSGESSQEIFNSLPLKIKLDRIICKNYDIMPQLEDEPTHATLNKLLDHIKNSNLEISDDVDISIHEIRLNTIRKLKDRLIDCIRAGLFDLKHVGDLLFSHKEINTSEVKQLLQSYVDAGLDLQDIHLQLFSTARRNNAWVENRYILEFVLEQAEL
jgi:hypothetical protein